MSLLDQIAQQHYAALPKGWQTKKIKFLADIQTSNVDKLTVDDEEPVRLCNYTDVYYNDRITPDLSFMEATATPKEIEKFTLQAGQVFITKDSEGWDDIGIPALVTEDMPGVLCGYHLAIFTPDSDKLDGAFLAWLCRADALNDQFKLSANGVTRFGLGQYPMKNAVVGYPPLETQKRIAVFLDEKTAQIDALIARKQTLLARLAEKRQAIITQAVTKGLNPAAPLKDSGIDWLGQVPAHWEVIKVKFATSHVVDCLHTTPTYHGDLIYPAIRTADVDRGVLLLDQARLVSQEIYNERIQRLKPVEGDVLYSREGERFGMAALVPPNTPLCLGQRMMMFRVTERFSPAYVMWTLNSDFIYQQVIVEAGGSTSPHVNIGDVINFPMLNPPLNEQRKIADYIEEHRLDIERMSEKVATSIEKLSEYRAAVITSAVTGQIEELR